MAACEGWVHWWPGSAYRLLPLRPHRGLQLADIRVDLGPLDWEHTGRLHRDRRENRAPWFLFAFLLICVCLAVLLRVFSVCMRRWVAVAVTVGAQCGAKSSQSV